MLARRRAAVLCALAVPLLAGAIAWRALHLTALGTLGTGYSAQMTCSCLFVSGRTFESCKGELEPLALKITSVRPGNGEVTASAFGVFSARSRFTKGAGCSLEN